VRISESIEKSGYFWLPEQSYAKSSGALKITISGDIQLDLSELSTSNPDRESRSGLVPYGYPTEEQRQIRRRIQGIVGGQRITLANCYLRQWDGRLGGGVATATYVATRAYFDLWSDGPVEPIFTTMTFEIEGLHDWLQFNSLTDTTEYTAEDSPATHQVTYSLPNAVTISLTDQSTLTFGLSASTPATGIGMTDAILTQQSYAKFSSQEPMQLRQFLDLTMKLQNLLALAFDEPLNLLSIQGQVPDEADDGGARPIDIYINSREQSNRKSHIAWHRALFSFPDIEDRLEALVNAWLSHYQNAETVFNLYCSVSSGAYRDIEGEFFALVQAVEGFHRRFLPNVPKLPEAEFKELERSAANAVAEQHRQLIHSNLQHANSPSLRERIEDMLEPFGKHFGDDAERQGLAKDIANTRNDLAHQIGQPDGPKERLLQVLVMSKQLEALLQSHLLRLLGIDDDRIDGFAEKHFDHKLNPQVQSLD